MILLICATVLTLVIWTTTLCWPLPERRSPLDFAPELVGIGRMMIALIVTTALWLVVILAP